MKSISHIYYTESDQILRFKNEKILNGILRVSNETSIIMGYRKQKDPNSSPKEYMSSLFATRGGCGKSGYQLNLQTYQINSNNNNNNNHNHTQKLKSQQDPQEESLKVENNRLGIQMRQRNSMMYKKQLRDSLLQMVASYRDDVNY